MSKILYNTNIIWKFGDTLMDKLIDFLRKEVPSNASDLDNSIKSTLEIIERTRAALASKIAKLFQDGKHDEMEIFTKRK